MENKERPDTTTGITSKEDLLKIGKEKFGEKIKYACSIQYPFSKENECMHRDCHAPANERIKIDSGETIHEVDCCAKHALYFSHVSEVHFPFKLGYTPVKF